MLDQTHRELLAHILGRDEAADQPVHSTFAVLDDDGRLDELRQQLNEAIGAGTIGLGDLAARMVSTSLLLGGEESWKLHEVDQSLGNTLAVGTADDSWYELPIAEQVDRTDLSWQNRRLFAEGRLAAPSLVTD